MSRLLAGLLVCASIGTAGAVVRVDEAATRVVLQNQISTVKLAVENTAERSLSARISLEWLGPRDEAGHPAVREEELKPGTGLVTIPLPLEGYNQELWARLRYRIHVDGGEITGILPLAQVADHVFELRVAAPFVAAAGESLRIPVFTRHPISQRPVAGVLVEIEDGPQKAYTDENGVAMLNFRVPDRPDDQNIELTVKGTLGDFSQEVDAEFTLNLQPRITITTDKPLYQPGQALHIRALIFSPAGQAVAGLPVSLRIFDPEGIRMFAAALQTTRFGVVTADWTVPGNVRLGDYEIVIHHDDFPADARQQVKISRYDLPEFTVTAKADRAYYLPGQDAVIEIKAAYLFGKPVPRGHVRVTVEQTPPRVYEAEGDAEGHASVSIPLAKAHRELAERERRLDDLPLVATYRDPSTGRTEQRRFDLRITREAIHIYAVRQDYLSTSYADGTPASCTVTIEPGGRVMTNRYGVAKLPDLPDGADLRFLADDGNGARGSLKEDSWNRPEPELVLRTDKTLYRPGEAIRVDIESVKGIGSVAFTVRHGSELLETKWLDLGRRRMAFEVPWRKEFTREVTVAANWGDQFAARTVLFPADTDLRIDVQPEATTYRPGEEAAASIAVSLPGGRPIESVLGIAVVDSAVGERARTDNESGNLLARWRWQTGVAELGGVSRDDLYRLDCSQPFPADLDLLAEAMLAGEGYGADIHTSTDYDEGLEFAFRQPLQAQFKPIAAALDAHYKQSYDYPRDAESLRRMLREDSLDFDSLRDPWGTGYRVTSEIRGPAEEMKCRSAGPDKQFGTGDDIVAWSVRRHYFRRIHDAAVGALWASGAFPASAGTARAALAAAHIDADGIVDPWGGRYRFRFEIRQGGAYITFTSAGPDGVFDTEDDFVVDQISGQYFKGTQSMLERLLAEAKVFPQSGREWVRFLRRVQVETPRDPWGRPLYPVFWHKSSYTDLRKLYTAARYGGSPQSRTRIVPVTVRFMSIRLRSAGPDGIEGNADDFDLAEFRRTYRIDEASPVRPGKAPPDGGGGSIAGRVRDPSGAGIPNAQVSAVRNGMAYTTQSASDGFFRLTSVSPGVYEIRIEAPGFQIFLASSVPISAHKRTPLNAVLRLGSVTETITVEAAPMLLQTESTQVSRVAGQRSTPRLREYFPETLLWQPSLETGPDGRAQLRFKLADNITTWKMSVIGSTADGQFGAATAEIRAFQAFFVDHAPPRILTQGDAIDLPVTVRNYLDQAQAVTVAMQPENWFELAGHAIHNIRAGAGESANAVFRLRATASVDAGRQRLTATSTAAGDAIQKNVSVHPDGEEITLSENTMLRGEGGLTVEIPAKAIEHSARAEFKIYPNLMSHLLESIEGILQRPHGCAEQTISSTYPSLLLLRALRQMNRAEHPLAARARRYLQAGVERLPGYRTDDGGLAYWSGGKPDPSLTAYGLTFVSEAAEFVSIDEDWMTQMRASLLKAEAKDGSWPAYNWRHEFDPKRTALQTAYIAQALGGPREALAWLAEKAAGMDEPYVIAAYALATHKAGDQAAFLTSLERLRRLARREAGLPYWDLQTNTPFYGWGLAGRLETSAVVLRALCAADMTADRELVGTGMLFLMRHKDRYGVWHSTQATVQALKAILDAGGLESPGGATSAEIVVNGKTAATVTLPAAGEVTGPVRADVSSFVSAGVNRVELLGGGGAPAQGQLNASYYVPWLKGREIQSAELRLRVSYDRTAAAAGEPITCRVHVERVGFHGYGMILAEIGLPPGADVDRPSLDSARLNHYDVLPDRLVAYLWPQAGGTDFSFRFRPRFAMRAKAAPSLLYDYYNPDARAIQAPASFTITAPKSSTASAGDSRPSARSASASRSAGRAASPRPSSRTGGS